MSIPRPILAAIASISVLGVLWTPGAPQLAPGAASPTSQDAAPDGEAAVGAGPFKPVARIGSLMTGIGTAFGEIQEALPQVEDEHRLGRVIKWSEVIAELSNVHTRHRRETWYLDMAADTRTLALDLAREARAETPDEAQLLELVEALDTSCIRCHDAG